MRQILMSFWMISSINSASISVISTEKNVEHSHKDLYDRNFTVVDLKFKFIINNDICNAQRIALVTIIHTAVDHHEVRSVIR